METATRKIKSSSQVFDVLNQTIQVLTEALNGSLERERQLETNLLALRGENRTEDQFDRDFKEWKNK